MGQVDVSDVLTSLAAALCAGRIDFSLPKSVRRSTWEGICAPWVNGRSAYCERLENVGDGVVGAFVTARIHEKYPSAGAGVMTVMKQAAVSNVVFALILELADPSISDARMRHDELSVRARTAALLSWGNRICKEAYCEPARAAIKALGDRFEALLGYLYLERGHESAIRWANKVFDPLLDVAYTTVLARGSSTVSVSEYAALSTSTSSQSISLSPSRLFTSVSSAPSALSSIPSSPLAASHSSSEYASKRKRRGDEVEDFGEYRHFDDDDIRNAFMTSEEAASMNAHSLLSRLQAPKRKRRRRSQKDAATSLDASLDISEDLGDLQQFTFTLRSHSRSDSESRSASLSASSSSTAATIFDRLPRLPLSHDRVKRRPLRQ